MPALGFVGLGQYLDANKGALGDQFDQTKKKADGLTDSGQQEDLSRSLGSENALAGMYGAPGNGGGSFDAALSWGAYGPQYKTLSEHLDQAANPPPHVMQVGSGISDSPVNGQQTARPTPITPAPSPGQTGGGDAGPMNNPAPEGGLVPNSGLRRALRQVGQ